MLRLIRVGCSSPRLVCVNAQTLAVGEAMVKARSGQRGLASFSQRPPMKNSYSAALLSSCAIAVVLTLGACSKTPEVSSTSEPAMPPTAAGPVNVSDADVTEHVKTALQNNDALKGFDITVITLKGDVRLIGVVDSQAQIDEAIGIARASDGAHSIHDELTLKK